MQRSKEEAELIRGALYEWEQEGTLDKPTADRLRNSLDEVPQGRMELARYFFIIAFFCALLAFGALILSDKLLEKIKLWFSWSDMVIAFITAVMAVVWFVYVERYAKRKSPMTRELYMVPGGLAVLTSLIYLCKAAGFDSTYYTVFLSLSALSLSTIAISLKSRLLWLSGMVGLIGWFGALSVALEHNYLFLGMNYAVRYVLFATIVLALAFVINNVGRVRFASRITYVCGLLLFFSSLWMVTIFGNFNSIEHWQHARQVQIVIYSVFLAAASVAAFILGTRYHDSFTRDVAVLFILLNLYTRYFEYFWDAMNKGLFFAVLAVTFGVLGRMLDRRAKRKNVLVKSNGK